MTGDYRPPPPRHSRENGNLHADPLVSRAVPSVSAVATKWRFPHLAAALGLGLLLAWATWPVVAGRLPGNLDLLLQFAPNATFLQRELTAARLPLWNPYVGTGVPFLADPGTAGWYLPSWLALLALSTADAIRLLLIAHLAWAAAGMYWCARRALGTGPAGAFVAAAVYAGGPFATSGLAGTLPAPFATAWLPWVLLAWHRCLDPPRATGHGPLVTARRCVVVAVLLVVQLSAGWPPGSALTILALAAMGLWRLARDLWPAAGGPWPARAVLAVARGRIAVGLLAALLTALLSALIVVPALEFIAHTHYAENRTLAEAARADYVTVLSVFGAAGGTGEQESNQFYSSVVVLGLALVGALAPLNRRPLSAGLLLGTVLVWCLGMGPRFPLFGLFYEWLPGFQVIHVPSRCALLVVCGLALLAGRGMDRATSVTWRVALLASAAPALLGLLALAQLWWSDGYDPFRRLLTNVGRFAGGPYLTHIQEAHLVAFGLAAALLWLAASGPWARFALLRRRLVSFSVFSVRSAAKNLPVALAVLVALDLLVWHGHQRPSTVPPAAWLPPPRPSLTQGDPAYRVIGFAVHGDSHFLNAFPQHVRTAQLPPNMPGLVGLPDAQAYGPLLLRRYTAYAAAANDSEPDSHWGLFSDPRSPLLDHLAVRWVLSAAPRWQVYGQPYVIERALPTDGQSVVLVQPADRPSARAVRLVTFLGEATAIRDNTPVAEVEVIGRPVAPSGSPVRHTMVLRAGVDTAEWAYGRSDVATIVQHRQAPVARRTRLLSVEAGNVTVFQYVATLRLPSALRIERIAARALPTETRAMVHVEAVWLDERADTPHLPSPPRHSRESGNPGAVNQATPGVQVYERATSLPRARWVPLAQPVADADAALAGLRAAGTDSRATTFIEVPPAQVAAVAGSSAATGSAAEVAVQWQQDSPTRIVLRVDAPAAGWLVLADAFYPGWEARLDGQPTPLYPADGLFRAVAVPPGPHEITFDFRPRSLRLGAALAAVGIVLAAAVLWLAGRGRFFATEQR